jgi:hypothetical protein
MKTPMTAEERTIRNRRKHANHKRNRRRAKQWPRDPGSLEQQRRMAEYLKGY